MPRSLASVAVHEAGHVVAMLGLGFPVESASIEPDADTAGRVVPERRATSSAVGPPLTHAQQAMVCVAAVMSYMGGMVAEELAGFAPSGCQDDAESVRILADGVWGLLDVPAYGWRHAAHAETERYLRENWPAVERVAAALLVERSVSGARARELAGALPAPNLRNLAGALDWWSGRATRGPKSDEIYPSRCSG